jgi:hypothetical protein
VTRNTNPCSHHGINSNTPILIVKFSLFVLLYSLAHELFGSKKKTIHAFDVRLTLYLLALVLHRDGEHELVQPPRDELGQRADESEQRVEVLGVLQVHQLQRPDVVEACARGWGLQHLV